MVMYTGTTGPLCNINTWLWTFLNSSLQSESEGGRVVSAELKPSHEMQLTSCVKRHIKRACKRVSWWCWLSRKLQRVWHFAEAELRQRAESWKVSWRPDFSEQGVREAATRSSTTPQFTNQVKNDLSGLEIRSRGKVCVPRTTSAIHSRSRC